MFKKIDVSLLEVDGVLEHIIEELEKDNQLVYQIYDGLTQKAVMVPYSKYQNSVDELAAFPSDEE